MAIVPAFCSGCSLSVSRYFPSAENEMPNGRNAPDVGDGEEPARRLAADLEDVDAVVLGARRDQSKTKATRLPSGRDCKAVDERCTARQGREDFGDLAADIDPHERW